jgi:argininosuccinate lyase
MQAAEFDRVQLAGRAAKDFLTVTELADTLVRNEGISFREAHDLVASAVQACGTDDSPATIASALLKLRPSLTLTEDQIAAVLDPRHFIRIRNIIGGPAKEQTSAALTEARQAQLNIETWLDSKTKLLSLSGAGFQLATGLQPGPTSI